MSKREACHTLVISLDEEMVKTAQEDGETVDPMDREFWQIRIRCETSREDFNRPCLMWLECECKLTEEQRDDLCNDGEGPCPESPTGVHQDYIGDLSPARPTKGCWAVMCDNSLEAVYELADKHHLGPGDYRINVHPDGESVEFELVVDGAA